MGEKSKKTTTKTRSKTAQTSSHKSNPSSNSSETINQHKEQDRTIRKKVRFLNQFINKHGIITPAAKSAGITRRQVLTWRKEDKEFNDKFIEAEAIACEFVESKMMDQIKSGNTTLTIFYLVNRSKGRWENIQKVEQKADESTTSKIDKLLDNTTKLLGMNE